MPAADVKAPPSIEYSPPVIVTAAALLMPVIVTSFDENTCPRTTLLVAWNWNASGVVSTARVVAVKVPVTPPTLSVALAGVENWPEEVTRTWIRWSLVKVPAAFVNAPPSIEYSPPLIVTGEEVLRPVIVTPFDTITTPRAVLTLFWNWNASGVGSAPPWSR